MNEITILYFASLADDLSCKIEQFKFDQERISVAELKTHLCVRGAAWKSKLNAPSTRCAVDKVLGNDDTLIEPNTEVAFFPPVTGG